MGKYEIVKKVGMLSKSGPAESTSRNPLEKPWSLSEEEFTRRTRGQSVKVFNAAHEETMSVMEDLVKVEKEIDDRVKNLYGL